MSGCGHASPRSAGALESPGVVVRAREPSQSKVGSPGVARGGGGCGGGTSSSSSQGVGALLAHDAPRRRRSAHALAVSTGSGSAAGDSPVATSPTRVMVNPADYPTTRFTTTSSTSSTSARASPGSLRLVPSTAAPSTAAAAIAALTAAANAAAPVSPRSPPGGTYPFPPTPASAAASAAAAAAAAAAPSSECSSPAAAAAAVTSLLQRGAGTPVPGILSPVVAALACEDDVVEAARCAGGAGVPGWEAAEGAEEPPVFAVNGPRDVLTATVFEQARKDTFYLLAVDFFPRWAAAVDAQLAAWGGDSAAAAVLRARVPRTLPAVLARRAWTESFAVFLRQQLAAENLRFYVAATEFRHTDFAGREMLELEAQRLFARYIAPGAPEQINTSAEISSALCRLLFSQSLDDYARTHAAPTAPADAAADAHAVAVAVPGPQATHERCRSSPSSPATVSAAAPVPGMPRTQSCTRGFLADGTPEPAPARKRLGFLRSLSHLSFGRRKDTASTSTSTATADSEAADGLPGTAGDDPALLFPGARQQQQLGTLHQNHFRSSSNLMLYQHQQQQQQPQYGPRTSSSSSSSSSTDAARHLARTQSASTGMCLFAGTAESRTTPSSPRGAGSSSSSSRADDLSPSSSSAAASLPCSLAASLRGTGGGGGGGGGGPAAASVATAPAAVGPFRPDVPSPLVVEIAPQTGDTPGTVLLTPRRSAPAGSARAPAPGDGLSPPVLPVPLLGPEAAVVSPRRRHKPKQRASLRAGALHDAGETGEAGGAGAASPGERHAGRLRSKKHGKRHAEDGDAQAGDDERARAAAAATSGAASVLLRKRAFTNGSGKTTAATTSTSTSASVSCSGSETPSEIIISVGSSRSEDDDEEPVQLTSIANLSR